MKNIISFKYDIIDKIVRGKRYRAAMVHMVCHRSSFEYDKSKKVKKGQLPELVQTTEVVIEEYAMTLEQLAVCANSFQEIYAAAVAAAPLDKKAYKPGKNKKKS